MGQTTDTMFFFFKKGPLGLLGKIVPLRAMLFETGFLKGKSGLIARIAESATASATAAA